MNSISTDLASYEIVVGKSSNRWVTSSREWIDLVDSFNGQVECATVDSDLNGPVAAASYVDDGNLIVSGIVDPAGVFYADDAEPADVYNASIVLAEHLRQVAARRDRAGVLIKLSATTISGFRGIDTALALAFDESGYSQSRRSFFGVRPVPEFDCLSGMSERFRTQVSAAGRLFRGKAATSADDLRSVLELYSEHANAKRTQMPFEADSFITLCRGEAPIMSARLYSIEGSADAIGYSISLHEGRGAELFSWGSVSPEATSKHLTKYIVADTVRDLATQGYSAIEYGCRFDGPVYGGLTEFYRRLGGEETAGVWMFKEIH